MEWIGLATLLGNVVVPPIYNLIKSWLSKGKPDTVEQTMSNLATTKPDILASYVTGLSQYMDAQTRYFNRDVSGTPSVWVINLRAVIRPVTVLISLGLLIGSYFTKIDPNILITCNGVIGNWIGTKIEIHP